MPVFISRILHCSGSPCIVNQEKGKLKDQEKRNNNFHYFADDMIPYIENLKKQSLTHWGYLINVEKDKQ